LEQERSSGIEEGHSDDEARLGRVVEQTRQEQPKRYGLGS
jgi:hypothetical protein